MFGRARLAQDAEHRLARGHLHRRPPVLRSGFRGQGSGFRVQGSGCSAVRPSCEREGKSLSINSQTRQLHANEGNQITRKGTSP